jgi:hypothetical protein
VLLIERWAILMAGLIGVVGRHLGYHNGRIIGVVGRQVGYLNGRIDRCCW